MEPAPGSVHFIGPKPDVAPISTANVSNYMSGQSTKILEEILSGVV